MFAETIAGQIVAGSYLPSVCLQNVCLQNAMTRTNTSDTITMPMAQCRLLLLSAVVGLALSADDHNVMTSLEGDTDLAAAPALKSKILAPIVRVKRGPAVHLTEKWEPIDVRAAEWQINLDECGADKACADRAGTKARNKERELLDSAEMPACVEKNHYLMEEIGVLKREIKAGEDKIAKFKKAIEKTKESDIVKAAAKEPAASAQANAKDNTQGKKAAELMLGDSKDEATDVSAETAILVPNRTLILEAISNKTNAGNIKHIFYESIFTCQAKSRELTSELAASKAARASCDTEQMRVAEDVQLTAGGGGN